ncbi:unnamed protein product, partial [Ilex paraguariensis]
IPAQEEVEETNAEGPDGALTPSTPELTLGGATIPKPPAEVLAANSPSSLVIPAALTSKTAFVPTTAKLPSSKPLKLLLLSYQ